MERNATQSCRLLDIYQLGVGWRTVFAWLKTSQALLSLQNSRAIETASTMLKTLASFRLKAGIGQFIVTARFGQSFTLRLPLPLPIFHFQFTHHHRLRHLVSSISIFNPAHSV